MARDLHWSESALAAAGLHTLLLVVSLSVVSSQHACLGSGDDGIG